MEKNMQNDEKVTQQRHFSSFLHVFLLFWRGRTAAVKTPWRHGVFTAALRPLQKWRKTCKKDEKVTQQRHFFIIFACFSPFLTQNYDQKSLNKEKKHKFWRKSDRNSWKRPNAASERHCKRCGGNPLSVAMKTVRVTCSFRCIRRSTRRFQCLSDAAFGIFYEFLSLFRHNLCFFSLFNDFWA